MLSGAGLPPPWVQAYVLPRLYPAVLFGLRGLTHLSLHHYEDYCLSELPAGLVPSLKVGGRSLAFCGGCWLLGAM